MPLNPLPVSNWRVVVVTIRQVKWQNPLMRPMHMWSSPSPSCSRPNDGNYDCMVMAFTKKYYYFYQLLHFEERGCKAVKPFPNL